ncbi:MAG: hypothetical protein MJE77_04375 [Proteobacteria bacterium]|nr:hypothetical protein [Pseudomonadota bacterium]
MAIENSSPYRIYLVLKPFSELLPHLPDLLAPLLDIEPHLPGIEGFYEDKTDAALLGLQFQRRAAERIGPNLLVELVTECGLPVIAPEELSESEYEGFFGQHLPTYPVQLRHYPNSSNGLSLVEGMVEALGAHAQGDGPVTTAVKSTLPAVEALGAHAQGDGAECEKDTEFDSLVEALREHAEKPDEGDNRANTASLSSGDTHGIGRMRAVPPSAPGAGEQAPQHARQYHAVYRERGEAGEFELAEGTDKYESMQRSIEPSAPPPGGRPASTWELELDDLEPENEGRASSQWELIS